MPSPPCRSWSPEPSASSQGSAADRGAGPAKARSLPSARGSRQPGAGRGRSDPTKPAGSGHLSQGSFKSPQTGIIPVGIRGACWIIGRPLFLSRPSWGNRCRSKPAVRIAGIGPRGVDRCRCMSGQGHRQSGTISKRYVHRSRKTRPPGQSSATRAGLNPWGCYASCVTPFRSSAALVCLSRTRRDSRYRVRSTRFSSALRFIRSRISSGVGITSKIDPSAVRRVGSRVGLFIAHSFVATVITMPRIVAMKAKCNLQTKPPQGLQGLQGCRKDLPLGSRSTLFHRQVTMGSIPFPSLPNAIVGGERFPVLGEGLFFQTLLDFAYRLVGVMLFVDPLIAFVVVRRRVAQRARLVRPPKCLVGPWGSRSASWASATRPEFKGVLLDDDRKPHRASRCPNRMGCVADPGRRDSGSKS